MKRWLALWLLLAGVLFASPALAWDYRLEEARTDDGHRLRLLRLRNPGGVPVLLAHGICSNLFFWNVEGRAFADFLADQGYDVWCLNFRKAGEGFLESEGPGDYSFDDLVVLDMPAAVARVRAATGRRPFLIGHSMGGMVSLAWLQGVERRWTTVRRIGPWRIAGERMVADPAEAAARAAMVRGVVAIGSPARFTWPLPSPGGSFSADAYWDSNLLLQYLAWSPSANTASILIPYIPFGEVADLLTEDIRAFPHSGLALRGHLQGVVDNVGDTFLTAQIMYPGSIEPTILGRTAYAFDDCPAPVLRQFMDGIRTGDMRELHVLDTARQPYSYADGQQRVQAPVLWIGGRYDKLGNEDAIAAIVPTIGHPDASFLRTDHGHIDLVLGDTAEHEVWAPILGWLRAR